MEEVLVCICWFMEEYIFRVCGIVKQSVLLISDGTTLAISLTTGSEWKPISWCKQESSGLLLSIASLLEK